MICKGCHRPIARGQPVVHTPEGPYHEPCALAADGADRGAPAATPDAAGHTDRIVLAVELETLSTEMQRVAEHMRQRPDPQGCLAQHGQELAGAAKVAAGWAKAIRRLP